jgi:L-cysteate sulfo-lyase
MRLEDFPRFPLVHAPTPLEPLDRLRRQIGGPRLYIKRDDCTGLALGGNKARKLEFLIGEALKLGATAVISEGGLQSNHVRQTAAAAAKAGLKCHLVLNHAVPIATDAYRHGGNMLLDRLLGAVVHLCKPGETRKARAETLMAELRAQGEVPYFIPTGGSNAMGSLGYVTLTLELTQQAAASGIAIDHLVVAGGSGGTQAGLIVGKAFAKARHNIIGIDIDGDYDTVVAEVKSVTEATARLLDLAQPIPATEVEVVRGYAAPGYGQPNPEMIRAVKLLATLEGILLDPVYTGKAMAGLLGLIAQGRFREDETVVFLHTGGMPALFAYADYF